MRKNKDLSHRYIQIEPELPPKGINDLANNLRTKYEDVIVDDTNKYIFIRVFYDKSLEQSKELAERIEKPLKEVYNKDIVFLDNKYTNKAFPKLIQSTEIKHYFKNPAKSKGILIEAEGDIIKDTLLHKTDQSKINEPHKAIIFNCLDKEEELCSSILAKYGIDPSKYFNRLDINDITIKRTILRCFCLAIRGDVFINEPMSVWKQVNIILKKYHIGYDRMFKLWIFRDNENNLVDYETILNYSGLYSMSYPIERLGMLIDLPEIHISIFNDFLEFLPENKSSKEIDELWKMYGFKSSKEDFIFVLLELLISQESALQTDPTKHKTCSIVLVFSGLQGSGKTSLMNALFNQPLVIHKYGFDPIQYVSVSNFMNNSSSELAVGIGKLKQQPSFMYGIDDYIPSKDVEYSNKSITSATHAPERKLHDSTQRQRHLFEGQVQTTNNVIDILYDVTGSRRYSIHVANNKVSYETIQNMVTDGFFYRLQGFILYELRNNYKYQASMRSTLEAKRIAANQEYNNSSKKIKELLGYFTSDINGTNKSEWLTKDEIFNVLPIRFDKEIVFNNACNIGMIDQIDTEDGYRYSLIPKKYTQENKTDFK